MKYINVEDVLDILNQIEDAQENGENFLSAARVMVEEQSFDPADYNFNEWCHDCKEYDQERHCCPRFNNVIRKTVQECREGYNIVYCKECEYYHDFGNFGKCDYFSNDEKHVDVLTNPYDWCSGAIRKNGEQHGPD